MYCFVHVAEDDADQKKVLELAQALLPSFKQHRILYHHSDIGKTAFVRQIVPHLHVDHSVEVLQSVRPHIPNTIQLMQRQTNAVGDGETADRSGVVVSGIECINSLAELLTVNIQKGGTTGAISSSNSGRR